MSSTSRGGRHWRRVREDRDEPGRGHSDAAARAAADRVDFSSLVVVLDSSKGLPASLAEAKAQAPVIAYGAFLNEIVTFLSVAFAAFLLVKQTNRWKESPPAATTRTCPFRLSDKVPIKASRCASCCADLPVSDART